MKMCPMFMTHQTNERSIPEPSGSNGRISCDLLDGLIGPHCALTVGIEGEQCESILDTGSQLTTISEKFHAAFLTSLPLKPIDCLLEIGGAGGHTDPYLGYVEANLTFPSTVTGTELELIVLALIVPECHFNSEAPLLVGINVLSQLYQHAVAHEGPRFLKRSDHFEKLLQQVVRDEVENKSCPVKLHGKKSIIGPPIQSVQVLRDVRTGKASTDTSFVLEPPELSPLPSGSMLQCALLNISCRAASRIPILIQNVTDQSVILQP